MAPKNAALAASSKPAKYGGNQKKKKAVTAATLSERFRISSPDVVQQLLCKQQEQIQNLTEELTQVKTQLSAQGASDPKKVIEKKVMQPLNNRYKTQLLQSSKKNHTPKPKSYMENYSKIANTLNKTPLNYKNQLLQSSKKNYTPKPKSYMENYTPKPKSYMENYLKIANTLNKTPLKNNDPKSKEIEQGFITNPTQKTNELIALPGCSANLVNAAYYYGLLYSVYTTNGEELSKLPQIQRIAKKYLEITKAEMIFLRIYSAPGEVTYEEIYPTVNFVRIGIAKNYVFPEKIIVQDQLKMEEIPELLSDKRAVKFKSISGAIMENMQKPIFVNHQENNLLVISQSTEYRNMAREICVQWIKGILKPDSPSKTRFLKTAKMKPETARKFCNYQKQNESHYCNYCNYQSQDYLEIMDFTQEDIGDIGESSYINEEPTDQEYMDPSFEI